MDELARYIFNWCQDLLTNEEREAHKHMIVLQKIEHTDFEPQKNIMRKKWLSHNTEVLKLLENGEEEFCKNVIGRVLRENPKKEFLNLCPNCGVLARTPKAKQCPKCFHSWH